MEEEEEEKKEEDVIKKRHMLGKMNIVCKHCRALKWRQEKPGLCCMNGQTELAPLPPPPTAIKKLLIEKDSKSNKPYIDQIRAYNQIFALYQLVQD